MGKHQNPLKAALLGPECACTQLHEIGRSFDAPSCKSFLLLEGGDVQKPASEMMERFCLVAVEWWWCGLSGDHTGLMCTVVMYSIPVSVRFVNLKKLVARDYCGLRSCGISSIPLSKFSIRRTSAGSSFAMAATTSLDRARS